MADRALMTLRRLLIGVALSLLGTAALAHRPSDAFLTLTVDGAHLGGQWEIALRDLQAATAVDGNGNGELTWGELRAAEAQLRRLLPAALAVSGDGLACQLKLTQLLVNDRVDGRYAWLGLAGECPRPPAALVVNYNFLFEVDPTHRGILVVNSATQTQSAVSSPAQAQVTFNLRSSSYWRQFADYLAAGMHHLWIGADHILFLLALLLPAVLRRDRHEWRGAERLRPVLFDVTMVVTAFTLAHSVTLALAALEWVRLPSRLVEAAIALSVLLAAFNNIIPVVTERRWAVALLFGLIHGFGFASVLGELSLPPQALLLSLLAFNLGVELGQLAIVIVAVPLAYSLRNRWLYLHGIRVAGSATVAAIAAVWLLQRTGLVDS